ncbi:5-oxoprolinase subunit B family protein [Nocardia flavorosea]|uniref:Allophanate hydrolase subunit 1 n=1 Tax=Nocardia flavorosea TaxID=53429 RepID=A0A846YUH2_9NOCA|nr:allophanate hydrolase subunit 1 [Nocardia flavorosea]NKY60639.1 allophanate hydrolase subunit 1 [Nocardia flavorosea]
MLRPAGDRAYLCTPDPDRVADLTAVLRDRSLPGVVDLLPAAETVLVTLDSPESAYRLRPEIERLAAAVNEAVPGNVSRGTLPRGEPLRIPVHYDGPDLPGVAEALGLRPDQVVAAHTGTVWRCSFVGFAPGFGYLEPPDARLAVARRPVPRTRIPAGSVALAGGYSAVYPRESPGGWQLIGRTDLVMWDTERDPPALIRAGGRIRFVDAAAGR